MLAGKSTLRRFWPDARRSLHVGLFGQTGATLQFSESWVRAKRIELSLHFEVLNLLRMLSVPLFQVKEGLVLLTYEGVVYSPTALR